MNKFNSFHLVNISPWPILAAGASMTLVLSLILLMNAVSFMSFTLSISITLIVAFSWWRDVHRESSWQGMHPDAVMNGLKMGMVLFIVSEVLFFMSFFWAFFHSSISPTIELGQSWPPFMIVSFNPMSIPLLNTVLLLSSGVSVTWAHHEMLKSKFFKSELALFLTIALGLIFTLFQGFEYVEAPFCMSDSSFGSTFFMATGFHGMHVIIGSVFLMVSLIRFNKMTNSVVHMVGFECAAWYWHFVDVVWLFLYSMLYWWGA